MILDPHSGTLRGFAILINVNGNCVQVVQVDTSPILVGQATSVELDIRPVYEVER